jgi:hypothetical protein
VAYDSASVELEKEILGKQSGLTSGKEGFGPNAKRKQELKNSADRILKIIRNKQLQGWNILTKKFLKYIPIWKPKESLRKLLKINSTVLQQDFRLWMNLEKTQQL